MGNRALKGDMSQVTCAPGRLISNQAKEVRKLAALMRPQSMQMQGKIAALDPLCPLLLEHDAFHRKSYSSPRDFVQDDTPAARASRRKTSVNRESLGYDELDDEPPQPLRHSMSQPRPSHPADYILADKTPVANLSHLSNRARDLLKSNARIRKEAKAGGKDWLARPSHVMGETL